MKTECDIVQLIAALNLDTNQQPVDHRTMATIIRYHKLYLINKRNSSLIYFNLGNDVSLRCVLGLPTLQVFDNNIYLLTGDLSCFATNKHFTLILDLQGKDLPEVVVFDNTTYTIPLEVSYNIKNES